MIGALVQARRARVAAQHLWRRGGLLAAACAELGSAQDAQREFKFAPARDPRYRMIDTHGGARDDAALEGVGDADLVVARAVVVVPLSAGAVKHHAPHRVELCALAARRHATHQRQARGTCRHG